MLCTVLHSNTDSSGDTVFDGCALWEDLTDETTYAYYYPDEDTYQYIYETIPQVKTGRRCLGCFL